MRVRLPILAAAIALATSPAGAQTVDEIVARHVAARGGLDKIASLQTIRMTGTMTMGPGLEVPFVLEMKRPNRMRLDMQVQGQTGTQAFDGTRGWMLMPFGGRSAPEPMPAEAVREAQEQADFDGVLVNRQAKGHEVELVGKEPVDGAEAYHLKVTLKNGSVRHLYLDAASFLEIKAEGTRTIRGNEVESESVIGDYREVGGLMFPHRMETGIKGVPQRQRMTVQRIELNVPIDDSRFAMPEQE
jgi:outer membrane lipoprotein-sorting protein